MKIIKAKDLVRDDQVAEADGFLFDVIRVEPAGNKVRVVVKSDFSISCRGERVLEVVPDFGFAVPELPESVVNQV